MDETVKPLRIPPQMSVYADKHNILHLIQSMVSSLVVDQPEDPISYLLALLRRNSVDVPRVMLLGPPAVGKSTVAKKLSGELKAVHVTAQSLLQDQSEAVPPDVMVELVQSRLKEADCTSKGWVLDGIPQTRLQALGLQHAGVIPQHVVMLEAPDDALRERNQGRMVDPVTGDVYHQTFVRPQNNTVAKRLEKRRSGQHVAELQRFRCEVTGLNSAYQHILRTVNGDQPPADVHQQVLAFVKTRRCYRTPRILLLGPPGSGKSYQARLLAEKYKMVDVCCGQLLRSVAADGSALGEKVRPYLSDKRQVPDALVLHVLEDRLKRMDCSCRGWILHGFPCNPAQAKRLKESLHQPNRVFFLEVTDDVCLERVTLRATDPVSGERFHAVTRPAPTPEVQKRLKTRPDDSTRIVTHVLKMYRSHTAALQSAFPDAIHINADQDPHTVFEALESRLSLTS